MPVLPPPCISLTADEVRLAWEERGRRSCSARVLDTVSTVLERMNDGHWLQPAYGYALWPVAGSGSGHLRLRGGGTLHSRLAVHRCGRATRLAAGICTVGSRLGHQIREWFAAGQAVKAVVLDEVGSLALYRLAGHLERQVRVEAQHLGLQSSGVLHPGDDGFELSEQRKVVELAGGADIGISLTSGVMLYPEKSLTMVMGLGDRMPVWGRDRGCARCRARRQCPYRHPHSADRAA
ncbi:MAG: hypothetical protein HYY48_01380 [Gammaproteobacteria bacterium]|nr:hypothetical protein [Gammaproteobacteria bacterium]